MDRRQFFKLAGVAATVSVGAGALMSCGGGSKADQGQNEMVSGWADINFEREVDVLVVGSGIGGLLAAYPPRERWLVCTHCRQGSYLWRRWHALCSCSVVLWIKI